MKYTFALLLALIMNLLSAQSVDSVAIKQVDSLIKVSRNFTAKNDFSNALVSIADAEKIAAERAGEESVSYASAIFNHGRIFAIKGEYAAAEQLYLQAKALREKILGKEHPDFAQSLHNLGVMYLNMGAPSKAKPLLGEAVAIRGRVCGKTHPDYASSLNSLANAYMGMNEFEKAEMLQNESAEIIRITLGAEHPEYAGSLNNLAALNIKMGRYEKAEPLLHQSKDIRERSYGKEHAKYLESLNNQAVLYERLFNYEKSERTRIEAISLAEKLYGKEHREYAANLINMAYLCFVQGDFEKAEHMLIKGNAINEKNQGADFLTGLNTLGAVYVSTQRLEEAEALFVKVCTLSEQLSGKESDNYTAALNNLAHICRDKGDWDTAEKLHTEAGEIWKKMYGRDHYRFASILNELGFIRDQHQEYEKAVALHLEAKAIHEKVLGKKSEFYVMTIKNLIPLYEILRKFDLSEPLMVELAELESEQLIKSASYLSERELGILSSIFQSSYNNLKSYTLSRQIGKQPLSNLPTLVFDQTLLYKGFLLNSAVGIGRAAHTYPAVVDVSIRLKGYRRQLAQELSKPLTERKNVTELEENANTAEKELARLISGYSQATKQVKWQQVQQILRSEEAAIEFIHFPVTFPQKSDSILYAALLLKPGEKQPKFIPLFDEKSLDSLLHSKSERKADYVNSLYSLADRGVIAIDAPKKSLYEILWKPLEKDLTGIKTIYFSPSGLLHRINMNAIPVSVPNDAGTETLADRFNLIEVNSTRQLVIPTQIKNVNNQAVLFGGIQYEQDTTLQNNEPILASRSRGELSFSPVDATLRGGSWNYLAGTEREVHSIEKLMLTAGLKVNLKKGYQATEATFKNIGANNAPSPKILHIATHGYFFPDPKVQSKSSGWSGQNEPVFKMSDHPMLRSGLIMAGGNAAWQGKQTLEGREDGILTAYEIRQMDLSNTELVVLSACETGLGDIQGNEGVYGLQRAFKIAGAKYLIMSLWQVPDKQTSLLMTTFYKKWLEEKMTIPDAFHAAQKELIDNGLDPYNWAGFVLVE